MRTLRCGISTCPNDTFAFHGLLAGRVASEDLRLDFVLEDVEALNGMMARGDLDVAKVSFHRALFDSEKVFVLPSGSALGFGVGPVVLRARPPEARAPGAEGSHPATSPRVLCPGAWTTATLLYRLFHPEQKTLEQVVFSEIMPRLLEGTADLGVCIHEGRFSYAKKGLHLVEDLGSRWEEATGAPLPLGGIVARRDLGQDVLARVQHLIATSIDHANAHPQDALPTMRTFAQELDDDAILAHVDLYVTPWTRDLGTQGRLALRTLWQLARERGAISADQPPLEVLSVG